MASYAKIHQPVSRSKEGEATTDPTDSLKCTVTSPVRTTIATGSGILRVSMIGKR